MSKKENLMLPELAGSNRRSIKSETISNSSHSLKSKKKKKHDRSPKIKTSQNDHDTNNTKSKQKLKKEKLGKIPFKCKYGIVSKYGVKFDDPVVIESATYEPINISYAFGCSMNGKYCNGKIKSIPCCRKIMYDSWYAADRYFTKHKVTYSLHWGSLLFAVRDGRHGAWDSKDIDLAFLWPKDAAHKAITEFMDGYQLKKDGSHHIMDWKQNFYKYHHKIYGYPSQEKKYCFYTQVSLAKHNNKLDRKHIKNKDQLIEMMQNPYGLILGGTSGFVDFTIGGIKSDGMGNYAKHIELDPKKLDKMIEVEYKGSNGIMPPRKIYIFPDYYKQLFFIYGDDWPNGYNSFFNDQEKQYFGLQTFKNSYFKAIYKTTLRKLHTFRKYKKAKLSKEQQERLKKFKKLQFVM